MVVLVESKLTVEIDDSGRSIEEKVFQKAFCFLLVCLCLLLMVVGWLGTGDLGLVSIVQRGRNGDEKSD